MPIFISETNLASLGSSGYESITSFMKDLFADGGSGVLEWEDGSQHMSAAQWSELDAALANAPGGTPPPGEEQPGDASALAGVHDFRPEERIQAGPHRASACIHQAPPNTAGPPHICLCAVIQACPRAGSIPIRRA